MAIMIHFFLVQLLALSSFFLHSSLAEPRCKCMPLDPCWPNAQAWSQLNSSVGGRLLQPKPLASSCYESTLDALKCSLVKSRNSDPLFRAANPGAMQYTNWETRGDQACPLNSTLSPSKACSQGSISEFSVNATSVEDVQAAVKFAARYNLRLVVKNTGHDYMGRSTAPDALSVWTHNFKDVIFHDAWVPRGDCGDRRGVKAVTTAAGDQWGKVYELADAAGVVVVGGMASSVGSTGGYLQGGGHGPLSREYGLAADNLLEAVVVTARGDVVVANGCQNQDLYWALRGGGGGTFGIVVYATHRTFPAPPRGMVGSAFLVNTTQGGLTALERVVKAFAEVQPGLSDRGFAGYFTIASTGISFGYHVLNGNVTDVEDMLSPFVKTASTTPGVTVQRAFVKQYPSFLAWYKEALCVFSPGTCIETTGKNLIVASRLIPRTAMENNASLLATTIVSALQDGVIKRMVGCFVAGGKVMVPTDSSVNPAWRKALWQLVLSTGWSDGTPVVQQRNLGYSLTAANTALRNITVGSGSYLNEADFFEPDWINSFFGAHYPRLKAIKLRVDPDGVFLCHNCVASEDWTHDLTCSISSDS